MSRTPRTILLTDDDPDFRMVLRDAIELQSPDCRVVEAGDGRETLAYLAHCGRDDSSPRPDMIFLDLQMPGMSGQEILKIIKSDPDLRSIPVVMMTGVDDESEKRHAAENGANSYNVKPSDPSAFVESLRASTCYWLTVHRFPAA
ncbi:MAG TPA: response regulator [Phycisphaerae bacterium]|nr:response regulator [Phycisphaerae bacterium]